MIVELSKKELMVVELNEKEFIEKILESNVRQWNITMVEFSYIVYEGVISYYERYELSIPIGDNAYKPVEYTKDIITILAPNTTFGKVNAGKDKTIYRLKQ